MTNIILCGKADDTSIADALLPALKPYGGVRYCGPGRVSESEGKPLSFFVYDCEAVPQVELKSGILLFKNSFRFRRKTPLPMGFYGVFESQNSHAAAALEGAEITAVTCGASQKDTLSAAALDETTAVLSLQRSLVALNGSVLEPHDFTVRLKSKLGPGRLLLVCAALLISGADSAAGFEV